MHSIIQIIAQVDRQVWSPVRNQVYCQAGVYLSTQVWLHLQDAKDGSMNQVRNHVIRRIVP